MEGIPELIFLQYRQLEVQAIDFLLSSGVCKYPLDPFELAKKSNWNVVPYSNLNDGEATRLREKGFSAFTVMEREKTTIYYDQTLPNSRMRFTLMHEIAHIVLGHHQESKLADMQANYFAGYAIAPSPIIYKHGCETINDIKVKFQISESCAEVRMEKYEHWLKFGILEHEKRLFDSII